MMIPVTKPFFDKEEFKLVKEVLESGWVVQGPMVEKFEKEVSKYVGMKYSVATTSCTTALHLALILLGVGEEDEVIVPSLTFVATVNAVMYVGAKPVFADIDPKTFNIDPKDIENKITRRTKVIMPAHQAGLVAPMVEIMALAKRKKLFVVEDAAPGIGGGIGNKMAGSFGDINCFSFHPRKVITSAEGGMLLTNRSDLAEKAKILRSHGASISDRKRHESKMFKKEEYKTLGYNYRMSDLHAAVGLAQMGKLNMLLRKRKLLAERYNKLLSKNKYIELPFTPKGYSHAYQQYFVCVSQKSPLKRDKLIERLTADGISPRIGIMAVHKEPFYKKMYSKLLLPHTEDIARRIISLPLYHTLTLKDQDLVIDSLFKHLK